MIKITELKLDVGQFGKKMNLVEVEPYYNYEKGEKTDIIGGYKYTVVLLDYNYEKLAVKIEGDRKIEELEKYDIPIKFKNLEVGLYQDFKTKVVNLKATADDIEIVQKG